MASDSSNQAGAAAAKTKPKLPPPPLSVRLQLFGLTAAIDAVERRDGTVNRCLYGVIDRLLSARANPRPDASGVRSFDFSMDASRGIWARVFAPVTADRPLPVVVYYHGGGFVLFSPAIGLPSTACAAACAPRSAPSWCPSTTAWPPSTGGPPPTTTASTRCGSSTPAAASRAWTTTCPSTSAAASLPGRARAATSCTTSPTAGPPRGRRPRGRSASPGVFPVQPYFGGVERTPSELALEGVAPVVNLRRSDFSWTAFLPVGATRDHPAAHVTDDNADLAEQFPPAMVIIGDFDPLMDWQRRYADVLRRKGKEVLVAEYPGMFHGFYGFPELPEATKVLQDMKAFVDSHRATPKLADA